MTTSRIFYIVLTAAGLASAVFLFSRQAALNELRRSNAALRQDLTAQAMSPAAAELVGTNAVAPLTPQEQTELLRLRGQIGQLHREAQGLSNSPRQ